MRSNRSRSRDGAPSATPRQQHSIDRVPNMDISYMAQPRRMQSDIDALVHLHRRVILIILLDDLRLLAADIESDAMDITTRAFEPELLQCEQRSFFTFSKLLTREQARHTTVQILLNSVVEYIFNTWGLTFAAQDISLIWQYSNGTDFVLGPQRTINNLLVEHRPFWLTGQGGGPHQIIPFRRQNSPYIMRLRCYKTPYTASNIAN